jgi:hypothetical protein
MENISISINSPRGTPQCHFILIITELEKLLIGGLKLMALSRTLQCILNLIFSEDCRIIIVKIPHI